MPRRTFLSRLQISLRDLMALMVVCAAVSVMVHYLLRAIQTPARSHRVILVIVVTSAPLILLSLLALLSDLVRLWEGSRFPRVRRGEPPHTEANNQDGSPPLDN